MASTATMIMRVLGDVTDAKTKLKELDRATQQFANNTQASLSTSKNAFAQFGSGMVNVGKNMQTLGAGLTKYVSLPLIALSGYAMKVAIDFDTAFAGVKKTIDEGTSLTGKVTDYETLKKSIVALSMELGVTHEEIAGIMQIAGQLGVRGNEELTAFTRAVAQLHITTGMANEEVAMMLGKFTAIMGTDVAKEIGNVADVVTALGNNSASTEKDILKFATRMAAAGRLIGLTEAQILAIGAAAESTGTKSERGGSALSKVFMAMQSEAAKAVVMSAKYQKEIDANGKELTIWTQKQLDAKIALDQYTKSGGDSQEELKKLRDAYNEATKEVNMLQESQKDLALTTAIANNEQGGFAKMLGITSAEYKALYDDKEGNGPLLLFRRFIDAVQTASGAGVDIKAMMKSLGLGDQRLMQAVQSIAAAGADLKDENGNYIEVATDMLNLLGIAESAWEGYGDQVGATEAEVAKRLDTTSKQWDILKTTMESIALLFTEDVNGGLKELLKSLNRVTKKFYDMLAALPPEKLQAIVKAVAGLIILGPGLSIVGKFLESFGTAFGLLGINIGGVTKKTEGLLGKLKDLMGFGNKNVGVNAVVSTIADSAPKISATAQMAIGTITAGVLQVASIITGQPSIDLGDGTTASSVMNVRDNKTGKFVKKAGVGGTVPTTDVVGAVADKADDVALGAVVADQVIDKADDVAKTAPAVGKASWLATMTDSVKGFFVAMKTKIIGLLQFTKNAFVNVFLGIPPLIAKAFASTKIGAFFAVLAVKIAPVVALLTKLGGKVMPLFVGILKKASVAMFGIAGILALLTVGLTLFFMTTKRDVKTTFDELTLKVTNFFMNFRIMLIRFRQDFPAVLQAFWDKFGEVLANLVPFLVSVIESLAGTIPFFLRAGIMLIQGLLDGFVQQLPALLDGGIRIVMALLEGLWSALPSIIDFVIQTAVTIGNALINSIPIIIEAVAKLAFELLAFLWTIITDGSLLDIGVQIIQGLIDGVLSMVESLWNAFIKLVGDLIIWVKELFGIHSPSTVFAEIGQFLMDGLIAGIKGMWELVKLAFGAIIDGIIFIFVNAPKWLFDIGKTILEGMWNGIKWYFDNYFKILFTVGKWVLDAVVGVATWLFEAGKSVLTGLWNGISWYYTNVFKAALVIGTWILNAVTGVGTWLFNAGKSVLTGLWDGIKWYYTNTFKAALNIGKWITDSIVGAGTLLYNTGKNIIQGLLDGLKSMASNIGTYFLNMLPDWIRIPFKAALGIKSPSRVFKGYGINIGEGLLLGMDAMKGDILKASEDLADATMIDPIAVNSAMAVNGGTITHDYSGLTEAFVQALDSVGLKVYMDSREVTDVIASQLATNNRRAR